MSGRLKQVLLYCGSNLVFFNSKDVVELLCKMSSHWRKYKKTVSLCHALCVASGGLLPLVMYYLTFRLL